MVAAPGLFSTTIGWPMSSDIFCPTRRAKKSVPPPRDKGRSDGLAWLDRSARRYSPELTRLPLKKSVKS